MSKNKKGISKRAYRKELLKLQKACYELEEQKYYNTADMSLRWLRTARVNSQTLKAQIIEAIDEWEVKKFDEMLMNKFLVEALGTDTNSKEDEVTTKNNMEGKVNE